MKVEYLKKEKDDYVLSKGITGRAILYELPEPFDPTHPLSRFWLNCYKCGIVANLGSHTSVEVKDGIVTINPSILCPREGCGAHYFITNGIIVN
jgi:hypothetical protein